MSDAPTPAAAAPVEVATFVADAYLPHGRDDAPTHAVLSIKGDEIKLVRWAADAADARGGALSYAAAAADFGGKVDTKLVSTPIVRSKKD